MNGPCLHTWYIATKHYQTQNSGSQSTRFLQCTEVNLGPGDVVLNGCLWSYMNDIGIVSKHKGRLSTWGSLLFVSPYSNLVWWKFGLVVTCWSWSINQRSYCTSGLVSTRIGDHASSVCNQPHRSTQPSHPFMHIHSEYQRKSAWPCLHVGTQWVSVRAWQQWHTMWYTRSMSVVLQHKLPSGWGLQKRGHCQHRPVDHCSWERTLCF